jgi:arginine decarboxylase
MELEALELQVIPETLLEPLALSAPVPILRKPWRIEDSENLYRIEGWGDPYFSINSAGHITVSPQGDHGGSLDLYELVEALRKRNIGLPLLLRFSDILADRINRYLSRCLSD